MAAVDYFLKIDTIDGESKDSKHKGEIDVMSFSWGESNAGDHGNAGGGGAGRVSVQDFHFVQRISKATPKLFLACATGQHIKTATLVARKAGKEQQEFLKVVMSDLLVSSYQTGGSEGDATIPVDAISLNFSKIEFEYKEQAADGSLGAAIKAGYDIKQNKAV